MKRFSAGVLIQLILNVVKSPIQFLRHPLLFFSILNRNTLNLGYFFGFYSFIYRVNYFNPFRFFNNFDFI